MPTGYTAALYDGKPQTFEEFALNAARAMGAGIRQRDNAPGPIDDVIGFDEHYIGEIAMELEALNEYKGYSEERWRSEELKSRTEKTNAVKRAIKKNAMLRHRYETMLAEVNAWVPPTKDHLGLKDFMVQQLTESIRFDCSSEYLTIPQKRSWKEFRDERIAGSEKRLQDARDGWDREREIVLTRNEWVRRLRESLEAQNEHL